MSSGDWQAWLYIAAVLIPLGAFTIELLFGRVLRRLNAYIATAAIASSCVLSVIGFVLYARENPGFIGSGKEAHHVTQGPEATTPDAAGHEQAEAGAHRGVGAWTATFRWVALGEGLVTGGAGDEADRAAPLPLEIRLGVYIDNLAVIMFVMVTFIATLIHIYSMGYMSDDPGYHRFFAFLSLFCFSMLGLVAASEIFMVFIFWELVGLCSYLLIGFWFEEKANADAANKAFIVNRVGDIGMLVGLGLLWAYLGTFNIAQINRQIRDAEGNLNVAVADGGQELAELRGRENGAPIINATTEKPYRMPVWLLAVAGLGIFAGCVGKSAQFPLHVWLPDAMAGPTPVSALIHAATMVAAGVYLVGRFFPLFTPGVLMVIAYTGGITLFIAASIAIVQVDYKKVLAYSTVSQLGFMMLALGVGGWAAGLFHLLTHAFFKALLFLGAGSIYHSVHTYDMRGLGGLRKKMPITATTMLLATLAISGVPFFSGFYSKDAIMGSALFFVRRHFAENPLHVLAFVLPAVGALMTAFYMFRMWFLVFSGTPRGFSPGAAPHGHGHGHGHHDLNPVEHAHESGPIMTWPLILLAIPTVLIGYPITLLPFWGYAPVLEHMLAVGAPLEAFELGATKYWAMGASVLIAAAGFGGAAAYYSPRRRFDPQRMAARFGGLYAFLVNKWYFDELYDALFVRPTLRLARFAADTDRLLIDGILDGTARATAGLSRLSGLFDLRIVDGLVNWTAHATYALGNWARALQTGRLRQYLMTLAVGMVGLFIFIYFWIR